MRHCKFCQMLLRSAKHIVFVLACIWLATSSIRNGSNSGMFAHVAGPWLIELGHSHDVGVAFQPSAESVHHLVVTLALSRRHGLQQNLCCRYLRWICCQS